MIRAAPKSRTEKIAIRIKFVKMTMEWMWTRRRITIHRTMMMKILIKRRVKRKMTKTPIKREEKKRMRVMRMEKRKRVMRMEKRKRVMKMRL